MPLWNKALSSTTGCVGAGFSFLGLFEVFVLVVVFGLVEGTVFLGLGVSVLLFAISGASSMSCVTTSSLEDAGCAAPDAAGGVKSACIGVRVVCCTSPVPASSVPKLTATPPALSV